MSKNGEFITYFLEKYLTLFVNSCKNVASTDDSTVLTTLGGSSQDSVTQLNGSNTVTSTTTQQSDENSHFGHFEHSNEELVQVVAANGNNKNGMSLQTIGYLYEMQLTKHFPL